MMMTETMKAITKEPRDKPKKKAKAKASPTLVIAIMHASMGKKGRKMPMMDDDEDDD